jgi:predicted N-acetyltransferase YhbS
MVKIRNYNSSDYKQVADLYKQSALYGGQYDDARDSEEKLQKLIENKPDAILVAESDNEIIGTVTIFEDGRFAWLYRFAVNKGEQESEATQMLWNKAGGILKKSGHTQVLVYAPAGDRNFEERYIQLGFKKGNDFTAYWQDLA